MRLGRTVARSGFPDWGQAMDGTDEAARFRVDVGLYESERRVEIDQATGKPRMVQRNRHASTRREVDAVPEVVALPLHRWTVVLVTARLRRMADLFTRFPMTADIRPAKIRSNMPEPVLERTRDYAPDPTPPRVPLRHNEIDLATATFKAVLGMVADNPIDRGIIWSIALRRSFEDCSKELREVHRPPIHITGRALNKRWAEKLGPAIAQLFNTIPIAILPPDIERAQRLLDRKMPTRKW